MTIEYRQAVLEDAELLVNIYNASFYDDYMRYGSCPEMLYHPYFPTGGLTPKDPYHPTFSIRLV